MQSLRPFRMQIMIQTAFISIFIVLTGILIVLFTYVGVKSSKLLSKNIMINVATSIRQKLELEIRPAESLTKITASLLINGVLDPQKMANYTYLIAKQLPKHIFDYPERIVGWGDVQGNLIETSLEPDGTYTTTIFEKKNTHLSSIKIYRDLNGKVIKRQLEHVSFNPLRMNWFITAKNTRNFTWTGYFLSYPYNNPSIAAVHPIYDQQDNLLGVFETEIKLVGLSEFLSKLKIGKTGQAFVIDAQNHLVAYDEMKKNIGQDMKRNSKNLLDKNKHPWLFYSLQLHMKNHQQYFRYKYGNEHYFAYFEDIPEFKEHGMKIAVVVPENDFLGEIKKTYIFCLILSIFTLIAGIFLVFIFSRHITNPIKILVNETDRIKKFDLDFNVEIVSYITEVRTLRDAINSMKNGLKSFQKYLPSDLVRQLIDSGKDANIGGENKKITSFFSDIRNFTTISEKMDSKQLMTHLCEYLDELSKIISSEKGTVDKYIGDSIMAFWGAPIEDNEHCFHACCAALRCQDRLQELNLIWEKQNKPQFITGIGINTGEAIVGNVGSVTRMNYTALGDSINLSSRLEALCKKYDSKIIVSESVVKAVKGKFKFDYIDQVEIRGKTGVHKIYELVRVC